VSVMRAVRAESGQTVAEYGVVLAVITVAVVLLVAAMSGAIVSLFQSVVGVFP